MEHKIEQLMGEIRTRDPEYSYANLARDSEMEQSHLRRIRSGKIGEAKRPTRQRIVDALSAAVGRVLSMADVFPTK